MSEDAGQRPDEEAVPEYTLISGRVALREAILALIAESRMTLNVLSYDLHHDIWAAPDTVEAVRRFCLQHDRARVNIIINQPRRTMAAGHRLVEFGRQLSSRIEFREIPHDRRDQVEDCVIGDGRRMVLRERPDDVEARVYQLAGPARLKNERFEAIWPHALPARELQQLRV